MGCPRPTDRWQDGWENGTCSFHEAGISYINHSIGHTKHEYMGRTRKKKSRRGKRIATNESAHAQHLPLRFQSIQRAETSNPQHQIRGHGMDKRRHKEQTNTETTTIWQQLGRPKLARSFFAVYTRGLHMVSDGVQKPGPKKERTSSY